MSIAHDNEPSPADRAYSSAESGTLGKLWSFTWTLDSASRASGFVAIELEDGRIVLGHLEECVDREQLVIGATMEISRVVNPDLPVGHQVFAWRPRP